MARSLLVGPTQPLRDLLRRPLALKFLLDDPAQTRVERELRQLRATRTLPRRPLSTLRAVAPTTAVAVDLPRDRRVRTTNRPPDRPQALTTRQAARNLLAPTPNHRHRSARLRDAGRTPQTQQHTQSRCPSPSLPRARSRATSTPRPTTPTPAHAATPATVPSPPPFRSASSQPGPPDDQAVHQPLETTRRRRSAVRPTYGPCCARRVRLGRRGPGAGPPRRVIRLGAGREARA